MRRPARSIWSHLFLTQLIVLSITLGVGFVLLAHNVRTHLDDDYLARATVIGQTVAQNPALRDCLEHPSRVCDAGIQTYATAVERGSGASYVVVIDRSRTRLSHPIRALIGKRVSEPFVVADGKVHLRTDPGATGRSANARVPLYGAAGAVIGEVSVGMRESSVSSTLWSELPSYAAWFAIALSLGVLISWLLARRLKRRTFGLELDEIAHLLQDREAAMHAIREGMLTIDPHGRVAMINDEARRLLRLPEDVVGKFVGEAFRAGHLRDVVAGVAGGEDQLVVTDDNVLVVNRMPVLVAGEEHGSVVTLRDRTELQALAAELAGARSLTEAMRAQQHEFRNEMHVVAGLLELDDGARALQYLTHLQGTAAELDHAVRSRIGPSQLVGLLHGKAAEAAERHIEFVLTEDSHLDADTTRVQTLTTVLGNLIDNAMDALSDLQEPPRRIEVSVSQAADGPVTVRVSDTGPGIAPDRLEQIFQTGYTTKSGRRNSGIGLALVRREVSRIGGSVDVRSGPDGSVFTVVVPALRSTTHPVAGS